jgi:hypothetical protein
MRIRTNLLALASSLALVSCAATQKQPQPSRALAVDCSGLSGDAVSSVYAPGNIKKVKTLYRQEFIARAIQPVFVSGAELQIPAQPGMTDAYLERELSCHAAWGPRAGTHDAVDPLSVRGVDDVDVKSVGGTTRIAITSMDRDAAKQIVQHARSLAAGGTVSVEQLSATTPANRSF